MFEEKLIYLYFTLARFRILIRAHVSIRHNIAVAAHYVRSRSRFELRRQFEEDESPPGISRDS